MIKCLVFDFDGTLADTLPLVKEFIKQKNKHQETTLDQLRNLGIKKVFQKNRVSVWQIPGLVKEYKIFMNKRIRLDVKTFKDIPKVISELNNDFKIGILTSNSKENVEIFLKKNHIENSFSFIYSDTSIFGKAVILKRLLKESGLKKNEIIYIGDENRDIIASKKVGITSIAVTWGYNSKDLLIKEKPDYIVDSPKEIIVSLFDITRKK